VASTVAAAPRLGTLNLFATVIFGQLVCSVLVDHFGVLYREHQLSAGRLAGVLLSAPAPRSCASSELLLS
jgi:uncharacterized membrane protein YdcZ (DUF606 family)